MSGFLLDTNVTSELIRPEPDPTVKTWVAAQPLDALFHLTAKLNASALRGLHTGAGAFCDRDRSSSARRSCRVDGLSERMEFHATGEEL